MKKIVPVLLCILTYIAPYTGFAASQGTSVDILVLGDSLSAEYGIEKGSGWVALLGKKMPKLLVINASISGDTTAGGLARLPVLLAQYHPKVLIIELGGNDGLRGLSVVDMQKNLTKMVRLHQNSNDKKERKTLLIGMQILPNYGKIYTTHFANVYQKVAKETQVSLVPFMLDGVTRFQDDRIHPSESMHPLILENIWPHLKPVL